MDNTTPRLRSITGVGQALMETLGVAEAVSVLIAQFGWDLAFQALANLEGPDGGHAMWLAVQAQTP